jgi:hypothetical protein
MGASQANLNPVLVDEDPWPLEEAGEDAVLAVFADETKLGSVKALAPTTVAEVVPAVRVARATVEPSERRPLSDLVRTLAIGCLSAMALGASFAIGFGYVWSDRAAPVTAPHATASGESTPRPYLPGWWMPLPQAASRRDASKASPPASKPIQPSTLRATAAAKAPKTLPSSADTRKPAAIERSPVGPAAARANESGVAAASAVEKKTADVEPTSAAAATDDDVLPSQAMLSGESAPTREWLATTESLSAARPDREAAAPPVLAHAASVPMSSRGDVDAVRHTIALYQSAYSQMDVGAMAAVWPSLDTASVERAFASVDRQSLTLSECRVTTAGNLATAVCPGQVRYVGRVGGRQLQERQGIWTIALERRGDAWQLVRLNVR